MATPSDKVHELAVAAQDKVEQLATVLAQNGADDKILAPIKQCSSVLKEVVKASGKSGADQPPVKEEPAQPRETIDSATDAMMSEAQARRQQQ